MSPKRPTDLRRIVAKQSETKPAADPAAEAERESGPERDGEAHVSKDTGRDTDLSRFAPPDDAASPTDGRAAEIEDAAARFLGGEESPVDPFDATLDAIDQRAGHLANERERLRGEASNGLQDDAARDDGVTGIAEQGSGAVSADLTTKKGRIEFMENLGGGGRDRGFSDEGVKARTSGLDLSEQSTSALEKAKLIQSNLIKGDDMSRQVVKVTPGGTVIEQTDAGVRIATTPDGKVIRTDPDKTRTLTQPDGSTTTVHPNGDVVETPPTKAHAPQPDAGQPDDEDAFDLDPDHVRLSGLDRFLDKIAPRPVEGGGHTDPVDDDLGFGGGVSGVAAGAVPDTQDLLLGGNTRGLDRSGGSGGSIDLDRALNPIGGGGAIDPTDDADVGFGGGGLEDDPFGGHGRPGADLSNRPDTTIDSGESGTSDAQDDGGEASDESTEPAEENPAAGADEIDLDNLEDDPFAGSDAEGDGSATLPSFELAHPGALTQPISFDGAARFGVDFSFEEPIGEADPF